MQKEANEISLPAIKAVKRRILESKEYEEKKDDGIDKEVKSNPGNPNKREKSRV